MDEMEMLIAKLRSELSEVANRNKLGDFCKEKEKYTF